MSKQIYKEINKAVQTAKNILITAHEKPDGDALGSIFAMIKYVKSFNKNYQVHLKDYDGSYDFPFLNFEFVDSSNDIDWDNIDLFIALDSGDLDRIGLPNIQEKKVSIINIDHHISNNNFGDINLVEPKASSTTEVIAKFFDYSRFKIDKNIASALLFGILTDTDNFTNKGTSKQSFSIAADLLKKGANINKINYNNDNTKQINVLKLWGKSFDRLEKNYAYNSVYTVLTKQEINNFENKESVENIDNLVNFFNNLKDPKFIMVLKEQEDGVKVSLRTTREDVDVSKIALFFNGGGHRKAAGFKIGGRIRETVNGWEVV